MKSYFPKAVSYNRFVELESRVFIQLMFFLNLGAFGRCTGITFVDSTMIPVCHNLRRYANKVFKGIATDGKGTMGWCLGFKLHLASSTISQKHCRDTASRTQSSSRCSESKAISFILFRNSRLMAWGGGVHTQHYYRIRLSVIPNRGINRI